jgi:hypothetical protein
MHPHLYNDFINRNFVVQKSDRKFSLIGKDHSPEQSKNLQAHGGAVGLHENHEALTLFILAVRDALRKFEVELDTTTSSAAHHEETSGF